MWRGTVQRALGIASLFLCACGGPVTVYYTPVDTEGRGSGETETDGAAAGDETGPSDGSEGASGGDPGSATSGPGGDSAGDDGSSGGGEGNSCAYEDVVVGSGSETLKGTAAGEIPQVVGEVIDRNCGCHLADSIEDVGPNAGSFGGGVSRPLVTFEQLHSDGAGGQKVYERMKERVLQESMPPFVCTTMSQDDIDTLVDWVDAGAPDGASYP